MKSRSLSRNLTVITLLILIAVSATAGVSAADAPGAPGSLDTTFNPGAGANDIVFAVAVQPDGKVVVGGQFTQFDGVAHNCLARLSPNGSLDAAYNPNVTGVGFAGVVSAALQPDGKAVIGGLFTEVNGVARVNVARLNADGTLDTTFNPGAGVTGEDAYLNIVQLQADGKILIGGIFSGYNGVTRNNIARLTSTGALDTPFNPGSGPDGEVTAIVVQPADGKILVGGYFDAVNGIARRGIARLNTNGSLDAAFAPVLDGDVLAIVPQPDGKIIIAGGFTTVNGVSRGRVARLNANGSLDTSFDPGAGTNRAVNALARQKDGKIVMGGRFTTVAGVERVRIARLQTDGALDTSFDPGAGANWTVFAVTLQSNGRVLIGGGFDAVDEVERHGVARLWGDYQTFLPVVLR